MTTEIAVAAFNSRNRERLEWITDEVSDFVQQRGWLTEEDYNEGMALAQLAPGPLAAQLAIYLGYCHYGILGASLVGVAFVLPSFAMVIAFSWPTSR